MTRKPDSYPLSAHLSVWAGKNGYHRLHWAIQCWWKIAHVFRQRILWPFQWNVWLPIRMMFMKRCPKHPEMVMAFGLCITCKMIQGKRLSDLKP